MSKDSYLNVIGDALRNPFCQGCFEPTVCAKEEGQTSTHQSICTAEQLSSIFSFSWVDSYRNICICKSCKILLHLNCIDSSFALHEVFDDQQGHKIYIFECEACVHKHKLGKAHCVECQHSDGYLMKLKDTDKSFVHFICAFGSSFYGFKSPSSLEVRQLNKKQKAVKFNCVFCNQPVKSSYIRCAEKGCLIVAHAYCLYKEKCSFLNSIPTIDKTHESLWDNFISVEKMESNARIEALVNEDKVFNKAQNYLKKFNLESKNEIVRSVKNKLCEIYEQQVTTYIAIRCDSHTRAHREALMLEEKNGNMVNCDNCFEWRIKNSIDNEELLGSTIFICDKCENILKVEQSIKENRIIHEIETFDKLVDLVTDLKNHNLYEILQIARIASQYKDCPNMLQETLLNIYINAINWTKGGLNKFKKRIAIDTSVVSFKKIVDTNFLKVFTDIPKKYLSNFDAKIDFFMKDHLLDEFVHILSETRGFLEREKQGFERYISLLDKQQMMSKQQVELSSGSAYIEILNLLLDIDSHNCIEMISNVANVSDCDTSLYANISTTMKNFKAFIELYTDKLKMKAESMKYSKKAILEIFSESEDKLANFLYDMIYRNGSNLIQLIIFKRLFSYYDIKIGTKGYVPKNAQDYINNKISLATGNLVLINNPGRFKRRASEDTSKVTSNLKKDPMINYIPIELKYGLIQDFIRTIKHYIINEDIQTELLGQTQEQKINYLLKVHLKFSNSDEMSCSLSNIIDNTLFNDIKEGKLYLSIDDLTILLKIIDLDDETISQLNNYTNSSLHLFSELNDFFFNKKTNLAELIETCEAALNTHQFVVTKERKFIELIQTIISFLSRIADRNIVEFALYDPSELGRLITNRDLSDEFGSLISIFENDEEAIMDLLSNIKDAYKDMYTSLLNILQCSIASVSPEKACSITEFLSNVLVECDLGEYNNQLEVVKKITHIRHLLRSLISSYNVLTSLNIYIQSDTLMKTVDKSIFYKLYSVLVSVIKEIDQLPEGLKIKYKATSMYLHKFKEYIEIVVFKLLLVNNLKSNLQFNVSRARINEIKDMIRRIFTSSKSLGSRILIDFFAAYDFIDQFEQIINDKPLRATQLFNIVHKHNMSFNNTGLSLLDKNIDNPYLKYFNDKKNLLDENKRQLNSFMSELSNQFTVLSQVVFKYLSGRILHHNITTVDKLTIDDLFKVSSAASMVITPKYNSMPVDSMCQSMIGQQRIFPELKKQFDNLMNKPAKMIKIFLNYQYMLIFSKILTDRPKLNILQSYIYMIQKQDELIGFFEETVAYAFNYAELQKVKDKLYKKPFDEEDLAALSSVIKYMYLAPTFGENDIKAIEMLMKVSHNARNSAPGKSAVDLKKFDELRRCINNASFDLSHEFENRVYGPVSKHQHLLDTYDKFYKPDRAHRNFLLCKYIQDELSSIQVDFNDINELLKPYDKDIRYYKKFYGELKTHVAKKTGTNFNQFLKYYEEIKSLNALSNQRKMILTFNILNVCFNRLLPDLISTMRNTVVDNLVYLFNFYSEMTLTLYGKTPQLKPGIDELVWVTYLRFVDLFIRKIKPSNRPSNVHEIQDNIFGSSINAPSDNSEHVYAESLEDLGVSINPLLYNLIEYICTRDASKFTEKEIIKQEDVFNQYNYLMGLIDYKIDRGERGFDNPKFKLLADKAQAKEGIVAKVRFLYKYNMPIVEEKLKLDEKDVFEKMKKTFAEGRSSKNPHKKNTSQCIRRSNTLIYNLNPERVVEETFKDKVVKALNSNKNLNASQNKIYINTFAIKLDKEIKVKDVKLKNLERFTNFLSNCKDPLQLIKEYLEKSLSLEKLVAKAKETKTEKVEKASATNRQAQPKVTNFFEATLDEINEGIQKEGNVLNKRESLFANINPQKSPASHYEDIFADDVLPSKKEEKIIPKKSKPIDQKKRINERFRNSRGICYEIKPENLITFTFVEKVKEGNESIKTTIKPKTLINFNQDLTLDELRLPKMNCVFKSSNIFAESRKCFAHSLLSYKDIGFYLNEVIFGYVYLEPLDLPPTFANELDHTFYAKGDGFSVYLYSTQAVPPDIIEKTKMFGLTSNPSLNDLKNLYFYFIKLKTKEESNEPIKYSLQRKTDQVEIESRNFANLIRQIQKSETKIEEKNEQPPQQVYPPNLFTPTMPQFNNRPGPPVNVFPQQFAANNIFSANSGNMNYKSYQQYQFGGAFSRPFQQNIDKPPFNGGVSDEDKKLEQLYEEYKKKTEDSDRNEYMIMVSRKYPELYYRLSNKIKGYT